MESTPTSFQKQNIFFLLAILRSAETDEEIENLRQSAKEQVASGMLTQAQGDEFDAACNKRLENSLSKQRIQQIEIDWTSSQNN